MKSKQGLSQLGNRPIWIFWTMLVAVLFFGPYLWALITLPGLGERACLVGASLTPENIIFSALISITTALTLFGVCLMHKQRAFRFRMAAGGAIGGILGFFSVFCTLCVVPIISVFGFSIGLGFFTTYNVMIKAVSLSLMFFVLWMINDKLKNCKACA
ncbi:MAG: hypothetical protein ACI9QC_000351 [Oceanicoccus sp.]|jgi:hypothetical protein